MEGVEAMIMFTPGAWWADDRNHIHNDPVGSVKVAKVDGASWEQAKANARLISAAPELLAALDQLVQMMAEWHKEFPEHIGDKESGAMDDAFSAIKKARDGVIPKQEFADADFEFCFRWWQNIGRGIRPKEGYNHDLHTAWVFNEFLNAVKNRKPEGFNFKGQLWRKVPSISPYTCEGCEAQAMDGVPCDAGIAGKTLCGHCGDGVLVRIKQEGGAV